MSRSGDRIPIPVDGEAADTADRQPASGDRPPTSPTTTVSPTQIAAGFGIIVALILLVLRRRRSGGD